MDPLEYLRKSSGTKKAPPPSLQPGNLIPGVPVENSVDPLKFLQSAPAPDTARAERATEITRKARAQSEIDEANVQRSKVSFSNVMKETARNVNTGVNNFVKNPKEGALQFGHVLYGALKGTVDAVPYMAKEDGTPDIKATASMFAPPAFKAVYDMAKAQSGEKPAHLQLGNLGQVLDKKMWTAVARHAGTGNLSEEQLDSLYDSYLEPYKDAEAGGKFASMLIPFEAAERVAVEGLAFAAPKFAQNHQLASKIISSTIGFNIAGQLTADPESTGEDRIERIPLDSLLGGVFPIAGAVFRGIGGRLFRNVEKTKFGEGEVQVAPLADGKPSPIVTTKDGTVSMATNNIEAVQNYIKSSGKVNIIIDERAAGRIGMTRDGLPVTAKHNFNPKTGLHTITVSSSADAETIAHEFGHYADDEVARQVRGLSTYLFGDATKVRNVQSVEDTLRSLATKQLAAEGRTAISGAMLDARMSELVASIRSEVRQLASTRPDPRKLSGATKMSENLADAISTTLTGPGANRRTNLFQFLKEASVVDDELVKALRAGKAAESTVEAGANKTALDIAKAEKEAAVTEKLGLGGEIPTSPVRPPNRKFELTKAQNEERALAQVPERFVGRSEAQIAGVLAKNKVPGKNVIEISGKGKRPVTLVVHEIDRVIAQAVLSGAKTKYMTYAIKAVQREFGYSERQAEAYIASRFNALKKFAESNSDAEGHVLAKIVRSGEPTGPAAEAQAMEKAVKEASDGVNTASKRVADLEKVRAKAEKAVTKAEEKVAKAQAMRDAAKQPATAAKREAQLADARRQLDDARRSLDDARRSGDDAKAALEEATGKQRAAQEATGKEAEPVESTDVPDEQYAATRKEAEAEFVERQGIPLPESEGARMKIDLDRMETGRQPNSPAFRAEKMTDDLDEEVFLNNQILPKITGKERVARSNQEIVDQAKLSNMTEEEAMNMLKQRYGALTPDTRRLFEYGMQRMRNLQKMLDGRTAEQLSEAELNAFKQEYIQAQQLFEVYTGARTEASNLLRSFGIASKDGEDDVLRTIFTDLKQAGIAEESDMWKALVKLHKAIKPESKADKAVKGILSAWLSGPATTLRNLTGTLSNVATEISSRAVNPRTMHEVPTMVSTMLRNWREGFHEAGKILKDTRGQGFEAIDPTMPIPSSVFGGEKTMYDKVAESVGRWLNAQDVAILRPLQKTEKELAAIYSPKMSEATSKALSETYGLSTIYRGLPKGDMMRGLTQGVERLSAVRINKSGTVPFIGEVPIMKPIIPFVRTIGNVIDRQLDYLPLVSFFRSHGKFIEKAAKEVAKKHGIVDAEQIALLTKRMHDQQMGRMYLGMTTTVAATVLAKSGRLSGNGPLNYNERVQLERTGWRRNSIKIGDVWVPYTYLGPLAAIFNMAGNIHDGIEYENADTGITGNALAIGLTGFMRTQLNASFFKGTADLLDAVSGNTNGGKYFTNLGVSLVPIPAAYSQTLAMGKNIYSRIVDDPALRQQYETRNIVEALRLKLGVTGPIGSMPGLNPRSDMFGEPMTLDIIYGLTPTVDKRDAMPVEDLLISNGMAVTMPSKGTTYKINGEERTLTPEEFTAYSRLSGRYIYEALTKQYPSLSKLKGQKLQDKIEDITRTQRAKARRELF